MLVRFYDDYFPRLTFLTRVLSVRCVDASLPAWDEAAAAKDGEEK